MSLKLARVNCISFTGLCRHVTFVSSRDLRSPVVGRGVNMDPGHNLISLLFNDNKITLTGYMF